jgi:hypothetical protein
VPAIARRNLKTGLKPAKKETKENWVGLSRQPRIEMRGKNRPAEGWSKMDEPRP